MVVELIRVVAVSPGDVRAERDVLQKVIEELNRAVAPSRGRRLSLWRWEADARPGLHLQGPQGLIDEKMKIEDADLVIGVFWKRFGTPMHDAQSGTEHELRRAWEAWNRKQRPDVMVYFCTRPYAPQAEEELAQWQQVLRFRDAMPEQQLWWRYQRVTEFERLTRNHLTEYLLGLPSIEESAAAMHATRPPRRRVRFNVPLALPYFTGREDELAALDEALGVSDQVVVTQAVTGLGGVGKSQLAARYLQARIDEYDVIAWIRAQDGGIADLADLAAELGESVEGLSPQELADRALRWLNHADERWLVVLDNIESPEQLRHCCPRSGNGRVVVTSRHRGMRQFGPVLAVDVFDEDTAIAFLTREAERPGDSAGARQVARALGFLPLALSHAASYCATGTSFEAYLDLLVALPAASMFDASPDVFYEQTVASTWQASIGAANGEAPLAARVLAIAAQLAPEAIPKSLFGVLIDANVPVERKGLSDAFNALHRFSLIDVDDHSVSVHRLVQKTVRDGTSATDNQSAASRAFGAIADAFPEDSALPTSWPLCEQLLPHVVAVADTLGPFANIGPQLIGLLNRGCDYLLHTGGGHRALSLAEITTGHAGRLLDAEHPETLRGCANLAVSYCLVGRMSDAIDLGKRVLADRERVLGADDPDTAIARGNLATFYWYAGRPGEATALAERVVTHLERSLGVGHPDTLGSRILLAAAYASAGRTSDALELEERVVADCKRHLGSDHPQTLRASGNLAASYREAGRTTDAIALGQRVFADRARTLGVDHPDTLKAGSGLTTYYREAGLSSDAIDLGERVLADCKRLLGDKHADTITARANLAASYRSAGRVREATALESQPAESDPAESRGER